METLISEYLAALAGCMCVEVNAISSTCFCGITVGDSYIATSGVGDCEGDGDEAGCGEAWVRITGAYPSATVGQSNPGLTDCATSIGLDLEMGVLRCMKILDEKQMPSATDLLEANEGSIRDMAALYRAMVCCDHFPSVSVGTWTPLGPDGGLVGGIWTLSVGLV